MLLPRLSLGSTRSDALAARQRGLGICGVIFFVSAAVGGLLWFCAGIRVTVVAAHAVWFAGVCFGIRDLPSCFKRRPCAGRHLLFFAAAKKSRQKKAANTANISHCLRPPPKGSYASHGNGSVGACCQRFE